MRSLLITPLRVSALARNHFPTCGRDYGNRPFRFPTWKFHTRFWRSSGSKRIPDLDYTVNTPVPLLFTDSSSISPDISVAYFRVRSGSRMCTMTRRTTHRSAKSCDQTSGHGVHSVQAHRGPPTGWFGLPNSIRAALLHFLSEHLPRQLSILASKLSLRRDYTSHLRRRNRSFGQREIVNKIHGTIDQVPCGALHMNCQESIIVWANLLSSSRWPIGRRVSHCPTWRCDRKPRR